MRRLDGFAATLGVPVAVLAESTGVHRCVAGPELAPEVVDTATLVWEVRRLTRDQESGLAEYAQASGSQ
ncbi:hypothetical protein [Streptomyces sp. NPDC055005]